MSLTVVASLGSRRSASRRTAASRSLIDPRSVVDEDQPFPSRWTFFIGLDGRILHIDKQVSPAVHGRNIALKLAELGVGKRKPGK